MEATTVKREYNTSDGYMMQEARLISTLYGQDLARFTAFDSTLTSTYGLAFASLIQSAEDLLTDDALIDLLAEKTTAVETAMGNCRRKYVEMRYFIVKTFPDDLDKQNRFGLNDYDVARRNSKSMLPFMKNMHTAAVQYQTELVANGCSAPKIAEIETLRQALRDADGDQVLTKTTRPETTGERINAYNAVYRMMMGINGAAQVVFIDEPDKQNQYVFDTTGDNYDSPGVYEGSIAAGAAIEVAHVVYNEDRMLTLENTGTTALQIWLNGGGLNTQGTVVDLPAATSSGGTTTTGPITMADLDNSGNHIIVKNAGTVLGNFKLTIGEV